MSLTFDYSFTAEGDTGTIVITTANTATDDTSYGTGYDITAISGEFDGKTISAEYGTGGANQTDSNGDPFDNVIFTDDSQGDPGSVDGIDDDGIDFTTTDGDDYEVFSDLSSSFDYSDHFNSDYITFNSVSSTCYCAGTRILTDQGEVPVEALGIGDHVVTASGAARPVKWIGHRAYSGRFANNNPDLLPIRFKAGSLAENVPARDLFVSPEHAMYLDGVLIPARHLINGVSVVKLDRVEDLAYYHVELESHDILLAEGAAAESFLDDESRGRFQNAHEYAALYGAEPAAETVFCALRIEAGEVLALVRQRLAERAGPAASVAPVFGALLGAVEHTDAAGVSGWARDMAYPDGPVCLEVLVDGVVAGLVLAETYRVDLARAGIGGGRHGFSFRFPKPVSPEAIMIRRAADGVLLPAAAVRLAA